MFLSNLTANPQYKALSGKQRSIYVVMAWRADTTGYMFTSFETLAEDTGLSISTIQRHLPGLIKTGLVTELSKGNSKTGASTYRVVILETPKKAASQNEVPVRVTDTYRSKIESTGQADLYVPVTVTDMYRSERPTKSIPLKNIPSKNVPERKEEEKIQQADLSGSSALDAGKDWDPQESMEQTRKLSLVKAKRESDYHKLSIAFETYNIDKDGINSYLDKCIEHGVDPYGHFMEEMQRQQEEKLKSVPPPNLKVWTQGDFELRIQKLIEQQGYPDPDRTQAKRIYSKAVELGRDPLEYCIEAIKFTKDKSSGTGS